MAGASNEVAGEGAPATCGHTHGCAGLRGEDGPSGARCAVEARGPPTLIHTDNARGIAWNVAANALRFIRPADGVDMRANFGRLDRWAAFKGRNAASAALPQCGSSGMQAKSLQTSDRVKVDIGPS